MTGQSTSSAKCSQKPEPSPFSSPLNISRTQSVVISRLLTRHLANHAQIVLAKYLTKRERKGMNAGIKEFDLKGPVFYLTLLPD
jgi:hypothetical protein